jgi:hypothetical protein
MPKTTTCTYHCSACGAHIHSLEAFDAHRQGDYAPSDPETGRHCAHPLDIDGRLAPLTVLAHSEGGTDRARGVMAGRGDGDVSLADAL